MLYHTAFSLFITSYNHIIKYQLLKTLCLNNFDLQIMHIEWFKCQELVFKEHKHSFNAYIEGSVFQNTISNNIESCWSMGDRDVKKIHLKAAVFSVIWVAYEHWERGYM